MHTYTHTHLLQHIQSFFLSVLPVIDCIISSVQSAVQIVVVTGNHNRCEVCQGSFNVQKDGAHLVTKTGSGTTVVVSNGFLSSSSSRSSGNLSSKPSGQPSRYPTSDASSKPTGQSSACRPSCRLFALQVNQVVGLVVCRPLSRRSSRLRVPVADRRAGLQVSRQRTYRAMYRAHECLSVEAANKFSFERVNVSIFTLILVSDIHLCLHLFAVMRRSSFCSCKAICASQ